MPTQQLVLSSSSKGRRELLKRLNLPFIPTSPNIDETPTANETADALVLRLAIEKAQASCNQYPTALIIGSDQVGSLNQTILSKPLTEEKAIQQLESVSGKTVRFYTGLCVLNAANNQYLTTVATYDVTFRPLNRSIIKQYLQKENALHCAGSFQVEGLGIALIERLEGDDYTALIGLPMIQLVAMLREFGLEVLE